MTGKGLGKCCNKFLFGFPHRDIIKSAITSAQEGKWYNTIMRCVVLGHVCIDKNVTEQSSYTAAGGPAVFMQKIFSQLPDITSTIVTPYGKDFLALAKNLPLYPPQPTTDRSLVYENIMKGKIRVQKALYREEAHELAIDTNLENLMKDADIVYIAPLLPTVPPAYLAKLLAVTKDSCLSVLLPQGYYRGITHDDSVIVRNFVEEPDLLPLVDMVLVSDQDSQEMEIEAEKWSKAYGVISVVTRGENGAVAIENGKKIDLPTNPVPHQDVVDSIGSGDIFSASFAYAYKKTQSIIKAGKFANEVARECLFYTADTITINSRFLMKLLQ